MLARLSIRDIVLIDQLDLEFSARVDILTGETGAGKSILLDALSLALGARGDGALVRHGAEPGPGHGRLRPAARPCNRSHALAEQDIARRGRADPAARPIRRRAHARFRQRSERQRPNAARARRGPGRNSRPARRARAARRLHPSRAGRRLWRPWRAVRDDPRRLRFAARDRGDAGGRARPCRRGAPGGRLRAPRPRGADQARPATGRGGSARRAPPAHDAGRESRRRYPRSA